MSKCRWLAIPSVLALSIASGCGGGGDESESHTASAASDVGSGVGFGTASITGKVTFDGAAPEAKSIRMNADPVCSLKHPDGREDYDYVVGADGGLKWTFVYVKEGVAGSYEPSGEVVLDQKGCTFEPHVFGIMAGQDLKILNSDETLHNVHALSNESRQFNLAMPRMGMELKQKFRNPEVMVRIKCDVHPWMECWAGVLSHPFHSVTSEDGSFKIDRLPAGTYTIEAWHENGGTQTQTVTVGDGESQEITFSFKSSV
jgi:plastocyanin